jgi:hypothetical protein
MKKQTIWVVAVVAVALTGAGALVAESPNLPSNCEPCRPEFSPSVPVICPFGHNTVQGYGPGGKWIGSFPNRCVACTFSDPVYCTVPGSGRTVRDLPDS